MKLKIVALFLSVILFSQNTFAQLCAVLKDARCGEYHTHAIDDHSNLWATGDGGSARGLGDIGQVYSLQRVKGLNGNGFLKNIISFDAGWYHSLAVDSNHYCLSWGGDDSGQLGNGDDGSSNVPIKVHGLNNDANGLRHIVVISAGRSGTHSLAVDSNGYVYGFGYNGYYVNGGAKVYHMAGGRILYHSN